jgi:protein-disulfide isomerase
MAFTLTRIAAAATLAGAAMLAPALAQAPAFNDQQRQSIERIVKEYLLKNPEVLQEAIAELEKRQQDSQKVAQQSAVRELRDQVANGFGSIVANAAGDTTLVEFFDYNCGYCKRALTDLRAVMKTDPKLKVVLKDFPILGPESVEASRVSLAVKQQLKGDKLFDYHVRLMETRGRVNGERAIAVAREMGLDVARLQRDMESEEVKKAIQENVALGDRLGLTGTPAFIIGEEVVSGAVGAEPMRKAIASVRQCGQTTC